jgi:hypothetical protein
LEAPADVVERQCPTEFVSLFKPER